MTFVDKAGRTIRLEECRYVIYAYHNGRQVGKAQFQVTECPAKFGQSFDFVQPSQIHIDQGYQRCGIGAQMICYAKELYDHVSFYPDTGCGGNTDEIHYTSAGLSFKQHCENLGITNEITDDED